VVATHPTLLEVDHLSKSYVTDRRSTTAIGDMNLSVTRGEFVCIVGTSGCGKTTLLKCMAGLLPPTSGEVRLAGRAITGPPKEMALVFQDYSRSLYPWMTVRQNIELPLKVKKTDKATMREGVIEAVESVGLTPFIDHYPWQLSGGMQQRVAIARAIAYQPQILLMDEPFASVDAQTRADLEDLIMRVHATYAMTVVFVTHDIDESVYLADRVIVLTKSPTEVQEEFAVDLPRPRDQVATKELPRFAELRAHVYTAIKDKARTVPTGMPQQEEHYA
jgi:NitT/TauT family transport system ATP-binding protein